MPKKRSPSEQKLLDMDFQTCSMKDAIELLREEIQDKFPQGLRDQTTAHVDAFVRQRGYFQAEQITPDDVQALMLFATLMLHSPQNQAVRLFATILQGLAVEAMRQAARATRYHQGIHERNNAIFRLMQSEIRPESC